MASSIFVNLPVKDLTKSKEFFAKLGFTFNAQFTNDEGACMVISETNNVMLLQESFFKTFIQKEVADATKTTEVILALSAGSKEEVNEMVDAAMAAGAGSAIEPKDFGFMASRSFQDLDGHQWEVFWMDPNHVQ